MILRRFEPGDKAAFLAMCRDFYSGGAVLKPIPEKNMETSFQEIISGSPDISGFMMVDGDEIVGYGIVYPFFSNEGGGRMLMLEEIYVKPDCRGRKFGSEYLNRIASAFSDDIAGLRLEISPGNESARRLYESMGFKKLGYESMIKAI